MKQCKIKMIVELLNKIDVVDYENKFIVESVIALTIYHKMQSSIKMLWTACQNFISFRPFLISNSNR
jgi:hypothetical protein